MPFILLITAFLFALRGNYYTASPQENGRAGPFSCQPNLEVNQTISVDIDDEKLYFPNGSPLYADKEGKTWVLIKRNAPIPAWKVWGGYKKTRNGVVVREMEEIGQTTPPTTANPDAWGKRVFIGLGHCQGTPGENCLDPLVQDTLFVAVKETYQSYGEIPQEARPKCEERDPITNKCKRMSWGDPKFEGYWWEFNIYLDKSLLPEAATIDDLPCWTRIACAGDIIADGGKRRQAMMDEYLKTGVCPVGEDPGTSSTQSLSLDSLSSGGFETAASPPTPTPTMTVIAAEGKSLKLGTFYPRVGFNYEWWTPACKPALYLYPQEPTELTVKVKPVGRLTASIPEYGEEGWQVVAYPDGTIRQSLYSIDTPEVKHQTLNDTSVENEKRITYPYLYYEAELEKIKVPEKGWIVERANLKNFFTSILPKLGLNKKESSDFLDYWLPKLSEGKIWFIGLIDREELDRVEPIEFSSPGTRHQIPDTFIRVRFYFERLEESKRTRDVRGTNLQDKSLFEPVSAAASFRAGASGPADSAGGELMNEQILFPSGSRERHGFTVVDWGGILANGSCGLKEKSQ